MVSDIKTFKFSEKESIFGVFLFVCFYIKSTFSVKDRSWSITVPRYLKELFQVLADKQVALGVLLALLLPHVCS